MSARVVWTYWISRDSLSGVLSGKCHLWYRKPLRVKHSYRVAWVATDVLDPGYLGEFEVPVIQGWFRTYPETDLELIRFEMYPTDEQIKDAAKA